MTNLPPGWVRVPLDKIADVQGGIQKQPKRRPTNNRYPFLRVANVLRGSLDLNEIHDVELFDGELERFALQAGDLLVVEGNGSPGHIGRAAIWGGEIADCVHQNHLVRVRPSPDILPRFLELAWNGPTVSGQLRARASSTSGLFTLSTAKIKSISIPLPPLAEQHRIVGFLNDQLERIDRALAIASPVPVRLEAIREGRIRDLIAHNAPQVPLGSLLAEPVTNGRSVPTRPGGFPVLRLTSVRRGVIDLSQRKDGDWSIQDAQAFLVQERDFLVVRGNGSLSLVGRGGVVPNRPDPIAFPDTLIRLRIDESRMDVRLFAAVWNSSIVRSQLEPQARTTAGIYKINQKMLGNITVPVPHRDHQDTILAEIQRTADALDVLSGACQSTLERGHSLKARLLDFAFTGQLLRESTSGESALTSPQQIRSQPGAHSRRHSEHRPEITHGADSASLEMTL